MNELSKNSLPWNFTHDSVLRLLPDQAQRLGIDNLEKEMRIWKALYTIPERFRLQPQRPGS